MNVQHGRALFVHAGDVDLLVDAFNASIYPAKPNGRMACSSWTHDRQVGLRAALAALPRYTDRGERIVDYHEAVAALEPFRCHKAAGVCDLWTTWMRARLAAVRFAVPVVYLASDGYPARDALPHHDPEEQD